jgi:hypothetical protein
MVAVEFIIMIIVCSGLVIERIMKHCKKSKCFGSEIEFNENASAPDLNVFRGR